MPAPAPPPPAAQALAPAVEHPENFPVASWLCPPALRPAVRAIYHYARTADDLADEGTAPPAERLADLAAYRQALRLAMQGQVAADSRWAAIFGPLAAAIAQHALPQRWLEALLDAFEQDVRGAPHPDRAALLAYCANSANPVGRLLLHLVGLGEDRQACEESDAICTALQLINFWQDLRVDLPRGRLYLPLADCTAHGLAPAELLAGRAPPGLPRLVAELAAWARALMLQGASLPRRLPGRFAWEMRAVVQGGLMVLDRLAAQDHDALRQRPVLRRRDRLRLVGRVLAMR
ncbi:squalene synthase HpnC [Aquariibacter albus]|uniref:Squalene synthase HpnC n=1 Tax=Aquariibacter albus TaxID=2759899 RepID=A0A839HHQ2_9BURK|nr:squalene synthase HpnC [Aquariibacter albus]MBB1161735.1 squalene synthase HpnC [Aquariibacter albus]